MKPFLWFDITLLCLSLPVTGLELTLSVLRLPHEENTHVKSMLTPLDTHTLTHTYPSRDVVMSRRGAGIYAPPSFAHPSNGGPR